MQVVRAPWASVCLSVCWLAILASAQNKSLQGKPISSTLCEVLAHPQNFDGKRVQFRASFISDGREHSILTFPGCKLGIIPFISDEREHHSDIEAFNAAWRTGERGTLDKKITAVFTGRFRNVPPSRRELEIDAITELQVTKSPAPKR
jgi:hypothetical protein